MYTALIIFIEYPPYNVCQIQLSPSNLNNFLLSKPYAFLIKWYTDVFLLMF